MAVTEVTRFRLKPGAATTDSIFAKLRRVKDKIEDAAGSKRFVHWFQQTDDPSYLYIICEEAAEAGRQQQFVAPEPRRDYMELDDFEPSETRTLHVGVSAWDIPVDAPLISIGSHKVAVHNKEEFEKKFRETRHLVDEYVARYRKGVGGWRMEKDDQELLGWVLFVGWESWEHHYKFIKTEAFKEYGKTLRLLEGYESKHAKIIDLDL